MAVRRLQVSARSVALGQRETRSGGHSCGPARWQPAVALRDGDPTLRYEPLKAHPLLHAKMQVEMGRVSHSEPFSRECPDF